VEKSHRGSGRVWFYKRPDLVLKLVAMDLDIRVLLNYVAK